jgi:hypothetical protein
MDNVSFHSAESAARWNYVYHRRIAREWELSKEGFQCKEIVNLLVDVGLMKTVADVGRCYEQLVKEFIVNVPASCHDIGSPDFHKVFVRGR